MIMRHTAASLLVGLAVMAIAPKARAAGQQMTATASMASVVQLNVLDGVLECGTIDLDVSATACGANKGTAGVEVISNSDYTLSVTDLGGAAEGTSDGEVTLYADIGRNGQFVLDVDLSITGGSATASQAVTLSPVGIRATGGAAEQFEATDDYGSYQGEFVVTLTGT